MILKRLISGLGGTIIPGGPGPTPSAYQPSIISNIGYYDGFLMHSRIFNGAGYGVFKRSPSHAAGGPLPLVKTTDHGLSYSINNITVDGTEIFSTNHSFIRLPSGRMIIAYKSDASIRFAYCDSDNHAFTSISTIVSPAVNFGISPSPIMMKVTSYGTIIFAYYAVGTSGNPAKGILMESTDNGLSFTQKCEMYSHNTVALDMPVTDWRGNEIAILETHPTGVQATSKWIAVVRTEQANDGGTYPMVFKSSDGANTWTMDTTADSGSFTDDLGNEVVSPNFLRCLLYSFLATNSPVDLILHQGTVYLVCGERNTTYGYAIKVITATPDGAFENKFSNWTRPTLVRMQFDTPTAGASIDNGYNLFFYDDLLNLFVTNYKYSTVAMQAGVTRAAMIETVQIPLV